MCCYKTHAAQSNELVTEDVELDCCVLAHDPYLQARLPAAAKSGNEILLPSNMAAKTTCRLYLVKRLIVTLRCAINVATSSF